MTRMSEYKAELNRRYWEYQQERFSEWHRFFERSRAQDGRPPVFLKQEARRNVIVRPDAGQEEVKRVVSMIAVADRHQWFGSMNSSQALAQSVFGNLQVSGELDRLNELTDEGENPLFGKARISADNFEMEFKIAYLGEPRRTSLDGHVKGSWRVAVECKFTEADFGHCSRPDLRKSDPTYERQYCDGTYSIKAGHTERCPLSEIGVEYWRRVPALFKWTNDADLPVCPLRDSYQLVRNLLSVGVAPGGKASPESGHVVVIYDERNPAFQEGGKALQTYMKTREALLQPEMLRRCSWQKITHHLRGMPSLRWLTDELMSKYGL